MRQAFTRVQSTQKTKRHQRTRRTALSLFVGGLFCSAAPAWADCVNEGTNVNGGLNITCEGPWLFNESILEGSLNNNTVSVQGDGNGSIYGSFANNNGSTSMMGNTVTLNDVQGGIHVFGSFLYNFAGSDSSVATALTSGNTVTLNNTNLTGTYQGVFGAYAWSNANQNANSTATTTATGNTVTLSNSSVGVGAGAGIGSGIVYGGYAEASRATIATATATDNTVTLNNSSVVDVYGGRASANNTMANSTATATATGNTVTLSNNSVSAGIVYGGYVYSDNSTATATGNTVTITDTSTVSGSLYGGFIQRYDAESLTSYDGFTGNTLNFAAAPITLSGEVANFENYNFTVDPALVNTDTALITAQTITFGTNATNMKGGEDNTSKIKVVGIKAGNELFADDKFVLMQATGTMSGAAKGLTTKGVAQQGISLLYDVETNVDLDGKLVTATIIGKEKPVDPVDPEKPVVPGGGGQAARVNPQLKSLSEGHLASAMMITRGADTLAYDTINTIKQQNQAKGWAPFINLSGDKTRYNSGSHINAKDALLTGGVSYQADKLTSAVLIESGWGSYDTHNSFNTLNSVKGDGHSRYLGLGVLGRYDFESGVYADASLRGGKNRNTFDTKDIQNLTTGERVHYNLDSNYVSAHVGTGYTKALDEKNTLDVSAKYLWTQLKGKDVKIAGDKIHFDDINSHRVRLNAGVAHQSTKAVQLRAGLGYEYEFDGKAKASTYGYDIAAPSVQGSTVIMTVGTTVTPMANQAFSIDMNANGYTGQRDGIGGNIKFSYAF